MADYMNYLPPSPPLPSTDTEYRSAAAELFLPDTGFITNRIMLASCEHELEGAEEKVIDVMVQASQVNWNF